MNEMKTFETYAIFKTGGKQYQAVEGKTIAIEKIDGQSGDALEFNEVLFRKTNTGSYEIGQPLVKGAVIKASIIKQIKNPKLIVFKFKRRKKVRVKKGHRQPMTVIRVHTV